MEANRDLHYCKHCSSHFRVKIDAEEDRALFLECPTWTCRWRHFRQFKDGTAIHCDITRRTNEPIVIRS